MSYKIRPLKWVEREGVTGKFDASTPVGHYIATITDDDRGMWFIVGQTMGAYMLPDIDVVKAAAQSDYEQRIQSALITAPQDNVSAYAERLAIALWEKHYKDSAPDWKPLTGDLMGLLTQIDNMTAALRGNQSNGGERTAPETCPNCFNESDCANVDICNAVEEVYRPSDTHSSRPEVSVGLTTSPELLALLERAKNHVMTPEEIYEQKRSFARGMCPSHRDYKEWCEQIDKLMPPLKATDPRP